MAVYSEKSYITCKFLLKVREIRVDLEKFVLEVLKPEELLEISKKYDVDIRIHAFERGMHFNQVVEIVNGKMVQDYVKYIDNYDWECICPEKGG